MQRSQLQSLQTEFAMAQRVLILDNQEAVKAIQAGDRRVRRVGRKPIISSTPPSQSFVTGSKALSLLFCTFVFFLCPRKTKLCVQLLFSGEPQQEQEQHEQQEVEEVQEGAVGGVG